MRAFFAVLTAFLALSLALVSRPAHAEAPDPELMARLIPHAEAIERMRTRATYLIEWEMDSVDGDGKVDGVKKLVGRVETDGGERSRAGRRLVHRRRQGQAGPTRCGKRPREAEPQGRERSARRSTSRCLSSRRRSRITSSTRSRVDPAEPSRVQIGFVPKRGPTEHTSEGSAWIDTKTATLISAGFKLSKPGFFVDYVHVTMEFGEPTSIGPAISRVTLDGRGASSSSTGSFTGTANLSEYRILP